MDGGTVCLAPYLVRLDFRETSLQTLEYVLEQLESASSFCVVTYLNLTPLESGNGYSATAMVCLPTFLYPEDWRDIRSFFQDMPDSEDLKN